MPIDIHSEGYKKQKKIDAKLKEIDSEGIKKTLELRKLQIDLCAKHSPFPPENTLRYTHDMFRCYINFYKGVR